MVGFNHAFREEAGGAGASTRGLYVLGSTYLHPGCICYVPYVDHSPFRHLVWLCFSVLAACPWFTC